ncbi:hypothetical protein I2F62_12345 [Acinetobacter sp. MD2(2019)]|nr:hypothetical protein [Acinetobacter sp. MD2(2019)]
MDFFVWLINFIESGKMKAWVVACVGLFVSYILYNFLALVLPIFANGFPDFQQWIYLHKYIFLIGCFAVITAPAIFCFYLCANELHYIYNKNDYR